MFDNIREEIIKHIGPEPYEILCNTCCGAITGYFVMRLAKSTAFIIGIALSIIEIWCENSWLDQTNWNDIFQYCESQCRGSGENLQQLLLIPRNKGFLGGVLIGASFT